MKGLMVMGAGDIDQQLFGRCAGNGFVISYDRPVERHGRYTAGEHEQGQETQQQAQ